MKTIFTTMLLLAQLGIITEAFCQNIAINEAGSLPDTSAILDVSSSSKGFLAPRMSTTLQNAIPQPANGLLIYNTTENVFKVNKGTPAAPQWIPLGFGNGSTTNTLTLTGTKLVSTVNGVSSGPTDLISMMNVAWNLNGNTGTSPATHFLGTTDNADFIFKTNSIEAMRLTGPRRLLGLNVSDPIYRIQVEDPAGPDADIAARMYNASNQNYFPSLQLQVAAGTHNAPLPVSSGTILGVLHFVGYDGGGWSDVIATGIEVKTSQNWTTAAHGAYMYFKTTANNSTAESERMRIDQNGYVGINTPTPGSHLDVKGTLRLSGANSGFVGFAPAPNAGATTYTLPATDGTNGQALTTDGAGQLSWSSAGTSTDISTLLNNNLTYSGTIETATAGEALAFGDLLYFDFATQKWKKGKADGPVTTPVQRIAVENIPANGSGKMLIDGFVRNDAWTFASATVYLSPSNAGAVTNTQPGNSGEQVQRIGTAFSPNKLHFQPSPEIRAL